MMTYAEFILIPKDRQSQLTSILQQYCEDREIGTFSPINDLAGLVEHAAKIVLPRVFEFSTNDGGTIHLCAWTEAHARQELEHTPWLKGRGPFALESSWIEWPGMGIITPQYERLDVYAEYYEG